MQSNNKVDITIGKPIANTQIYILDKYGKVVPIGVTGELCIAGDGVGLGYLNRPELTAEKFVPNPFGEGKMYKTGDLAYWREDGNIAFVGRNDFQVKIRGLRIELGEIENAISCIDGVSLCIVIVRKNSEGRQLICAFYSGEKLGAAEMRRSIAEKLPKYMLPHIFTHLEVMPLTPSGKINRNALPEVDLENISNDTEYVPPVNATQKLLCSIIADSLNAERVGLADDFFDMGGDSLKAIEFVSKAHAEGVYFSLQDVFDHPTVQTLCEYISSADKGHKKFNPEDFTNINKLIQSNKSDDYTAERIDIGNILLTGATGFLGIHILSEFIENEKGTAYCIVRGKNEVDATERLKGFLQYYFSGKYLDLIGNRIVVLCGDVQRENLGLGSIPEVQTVINAAASVKHYGSYKYFYEANVQSVKNLIEVAESRDACFVHTSTLSVSGNSFADEFDAYRSDVEKHFGEHDLYIGQPLDNVYARSKFEAEKLIFEEMQNGLKANILRMGNLTNRAKDGAFQKNYESNAFAQRVKAVADLGVFPDYLMPLYTEFTPIDEAAKAVLLITEHFNSVHNVFHINSTKVVYMEKLLEYFNSLGVKVNTVSAAEFSNALRETAKQSGAEHIFETFINDMDENEHLNYDSNIRIDNDITVSYLRRLGFEWSDIDMDYISKWVEWFRSVGFLM